MQSIAVADVYQRVCYVIHNMYDNNCVNIMNSEIQYIYGKYICSTHVCTYVLDYSLKANLCVPHGKVTHH